MVPKDRVKTPNYEFEMPVDFTIIPLVNPAISNMTYIIVAMMNTSGGLLQLYSSPPNILNDTFIKIWIHDAKTIMSKLCPMLKEIDDNHLQFEPVTTPTGTEISVTIKPISKQHSISIHDHSVLFEVTESGTINKSSIKLAQAFFF